MTDEETKRILEAIGRHGKTVEQMKSIADESQVADLLDRGLIRRHWIEMQETHGGLGDRSPGGVHTYVLTAAGAEFIGLDPRELP